MTRLPVDAAVVSLFVPDVAGSLALTAQQQGTDSAGRTTWVLGPGVASGALASPTASFGPSVSLHPFPPLHATPLTRIVPARVQSR